MPKTQTKNKRMLKSSTKTNNDQSKRESYFNETPGPSPTEDPVAWAEKFIEGQIAQSAKELAYQLKFGDDKTRKEIALDFLSFKGITKKGDNNGQVVPAIQVIMSGAAPWTQLTVQNKPASLIEGEVVKTKKEE